MQELQLIQPEEITRDRFDHKNPERFIAKAPIGLSREVVEMISKSKNEPDWMLQKRLKALEIFNKTAIPTWGPDLSNLALNEITYFIIPDKKSHAQKWEDVPEDIKRTFEKLGIPKAEQRALAGAGAQYESLNAYHNLKKEWEAKGVIFEDMDVAVQKYPELVKAYFMTRCVPINDHKFAALHAAVWSGGTFIYVPPNVKVTQPLQAYFRMNAAGAGQFEHTLIIVDKSAEVSYIEGCSAPRYNVNNLHAGCVEIYVKENARARYSSVENWSKNTYNLNTKRAIVEKSGTIEWINGNNGCLTGDTRVYTNPKGPVRIDEIKAGDYVYGFDLNSLSPIKAKVNATKCSGIKNVYQIETDNFRTIKASDNHPFLTIDDGKRFISWKMLKELKQNDFICTINAIPEEGAAVALPKIERKGKNCVTVPEQTNEEIMWILGVYVGDGFLSKEALSKKSKEKVDRRVYFAVPEEDKIRRKLESTLKEIFGATITKKGICITLNSIMFCELIRKMGLSGNAHTKRIPQWIFGLPLAQKLAFIEGYLDSDGYVRKNARRKNIAIGGTFSSANKELLEDFKNLMIMCGLNPGKLLTYKRKIPSKTAKGNREYYNNFINITAEDIEKIRQRKAMPKHFARFSRVRSIHLLGEKMTYDIEIDGISNFIANGIVVHNSHITMLYPCSVLKGEGARSDFLGIAFAGSGQFQDTGAKVFHLAPNTTSVTRSKSISKDGGITNFRGLLKVVKGAVNSKATMQCDALMLDDRSKSDTTPHLEIKENKVHIGHEATVGKISSEQLFYLMSRGLTEEEAMKMIVSGFIEPIVKELPLEYAVELNRLIQLEIENAIG